MTNLEVEIAIAAAQGEPPAESEASRVVGAMLALIDQHGDHVLWRVNPRRVGALASVLRDPC